MGVPKEGPLSTAQKVIIARFMRAEQVVKAFDRATSDLLDRSNPSLWQSENSNWAIVLRKAYEELKEDERTNGVARARGGRLTQVQEEIVARLMRAERVVYKVDTIYRPYSPPGLRRHLNSNWAIVLCTAYDELKEDERKNGTQ